VPATKKRAVVEAVIRAASGLSGEVARLLTMLADRDRLHLIDEIAALYEERLLALRKVVSAEIVTASGMDARARDAVTRALAHATSGEVRLTERVDPEIIGGMTATVGSVVFDGSVATQLERMRQRLHQ
jgi:F-type H+-transporting ATPase subunit delta